MQWVGAGEVKETQRSRRGRRRVEDMMAVRGGRRGGGSVDGSDSRGSKGAGGRGHGRDGRVEASGGWRTG